VEFSALRAKHSRIVIQRFDPRRKRTPEVRMLRVQKPVVFMRREGRRHNQDASGTFPDESVADAGKLSRGWGMAPVGWKFLGCDALLRCVVGNLCSG